MQSIIEINCVFMVTKVPLTHFFAYFINTKGINNYVWYVYVEHALTTA